MAPQVGWLGQLGSQLHTNSVAACPCTVPCRAESPPVANESIRSESRFSLIFFVSVSLPAGRGRRAATGAGQIGPSGTGRHSDAYGSQVQPARVFQQPHEQVAPQVPQYVAPQVLSGACDWQ